MNHRFQRHHRQVWLGKENVPSLHKTKDDNEISGIALSHDNVAGRKTTKKTDLGQSKVKICSRTRGRGRKKVLGIKVYFTVCNVGYETVTQRCRSENRGATPFECDVSNRRCSYPSDLLKHRRTHTGRDLFKNSKPWAKKGTWYKSIFYSLQRRLRNSHSAQPQPKLRIKLFQPKYSKAPMRQSDKKIMIFNCCREK